MTNKQPAQSFKVGDRVTIRSWPKLRARIVEERGPSGPGGALVYRIRIAGKPKSSYVEVREDQLIAIPPTPEGELISAAKRRARGEPVGPRDAEVDAESKTTGQSSQPFKLGDRVKIRYAGWTGRIVEERGALGPGGLLVYRVRVARKPKPVCVEFTEDQLIAIPAAQNGEHTPSTGRRAGREAQGE